MQMLDFVSEAERPSRCDLTLKHIVDELHRKLVVANSGALEFDFNWHSRRVVRLQPGMAPTQLHSDRSLHEDRVARRVDEK